MDGFLGIDKPRGMTSFEVVRAVRSALGERRTGHAGTLDPAATGVLVVAVGRCTRLLPYAPVEPKEYEFTICFGVETDTQDETGRETVRCDTTPSEDAVREVLVRFIGTVTQSPPRFSAVKIDGMRAYARARRNEEFLTPPRQVRIEELRLLSFHAERRAARCRLRCSGGTYVRALASDIARALGTCGHAADIRRAAVGRFRIETALPFTKSPERLRAAIMPLEQVFAGQTQPRLDRGQIREVSFGRRIRLSHLSETGPVVAFSTAGELAAVLENVGDNWWKPVRVFTSPHRSRGGTT